MRFEVKKDGIIDFIFDNKTEEYYTEILTDTDTLKVICNIWNTLDSKSQRCGEKLREVSKENCELQRKVEVLSKFADPVEVNKYWERLTNE